jgi:hypothetical protein
MSLRTLSNQTIAAAVDSAQAKVVKETAELENVQAQTERVFELVKRGVYPASKADTARAAQDVREVEALRELRVDEQTDLELRLPRFSGRNRCRVLERRPFVERLKTDTRRRLGRERCVFRHRCTLRWRVPDWGSLMTRRWRERDSNPRSPGEREGLSALERSGLAFFGESSWKSSVLVFGKKAGLDPQKIYEVVRVSTGSSVQFENRVPRMLARNFVPGGTIDILVQGPRARNHIC